MDKIKLKSLLLIFFISSSYLDAQDITRIILHTNESLVSTDDQVEENKLLVLPNSIAFKDSGNNLLGFQQIGDYKFLIDASNLDDAKRTYMDDLNIADKDKLFVIKSNIENSFTFSNGEIIIFSNSSSDINDFINENNSSLFLVSSFSSYSVVKVKNIFDINFIFDQLLKDNRFRGAQLNSINPYLSAN